MVVLADGIVGKGAAALGVKYRDHRVGPLMMPFMLYLNDNAPGFPTLGSQNVGPCSDALDTSIATSVVTAGAKKPQANHRVERDRLIR